MSLVINRLGILVLIISNNLYIRVNNLRVDYIRIGPNLLHTMIVPQSLPPWVDIL